MKWKMSLDQTVCEGKNDKPMAEMISLVMYLETNESNITSYIYSNE